MTRREQGLLGRRICTWNCGRKKAHLKTSRSGRRLTKRKKKSNQKRNFSNNVKEVVTNRGHNVPNNFPFIIDSKFESVTDSRSRRNSAEIRIHRRIRAFKRKESQSRKRKGKRQKIQEKERNPCSRCKHRQFDEITFKHSRNRYC